MDKSVKLKEFEAIRALVETQNLLINTFEEYSKQASEPQLREVFQKVCASASNNKVKLLKALEVKNE